MVTTNPTLTTNLTRTLTLILIPALLSSQWDYISSSILWGEPDHPALLLSQSSRIVLCSSAGFLQGHKRRLQNRVIFWEVKDNQVSEGADRPRGAAEQEDNAGPRSRVPQRPQKRIKERNGTRNQVSTRVLSSGDGRSAVRGSGSSSRGASGSSSPPIGRPGTRALSQGSAPPHPHRGPQVRLF